MRYKGVVPYIRDRVAVKLGLLLAAIFLFFLFVLGALLYSLFVSFYLSHVTEELWQRARSHAVVLSSHFEAVTIEHVVRMEEGSNHRIVVLNPARQILAGSEPLTDWQRAYIASSPAAEKEGMKMGDWKSQPFLAARAPLRYGPNELGEIIMFTPTAPIHEAVHVLRGMLLLAGVAAVIIVGGVLLLFSRMLVRPLVEMKHATKAIADGQYDVALPVRGHDEVAQLAASIQHMSGQIRFYQAQRNEFLADIGHELRTPITYMKGYAEVLRDAPDVGEEGRAYARTIYEQSVRLQRLVQDLFDLARMEHGDLSFVAERFRLEEAVTDTLSLVEGQMDERNIRLVYTPPSAPVYIEGDRHRISQVLLNVLENARRYVPEGEMVSVRVKQIGEQAVVEIADTGPGIPAGELPYVMERLYRVEKSRSQETGGSGLGLAISQEIMKKHRGILRVRSAEGKGTIFTIELPASNFLHNLGIQ